MTPPVGHSRTAKHCPCELICQNIAVLFRGVKFGFKRVTFQRSLIADGFRNFVMNDLIPKSSSAILEAFFIMEILAQVIGIKTQV